jgi:hypothetical protein
MNSQHDQQLNQPNQETSHNLDSQNQSGGEKHGRPSKGKKLAIFIAAGLGIIIINTVVPFLYAYGMHKGNDVLCHRATHFLEELKAENNHIIRMWEGAGLSAENAADSQALIQLKKEYCDKRNCLRCRFGYEFLKRNKKSL